MTRRHVKSRYGGGLKYVVLQVHHDNTTRAWGPFTKDRAWLAKDALLAQTGTKGIQLLPLKPSSELDVETPDWKRKT